MKDISWSKEDFLQIEAKGINEKQLELQLKQFVEGIPFENLIAPATIDNGIVRLEENRKKNWIEKFERSSAKKLKFVPASGAATRMFKNLFFFLEEFNHDEESLEDFVKRTDKKELRKFFQQVKNLPFYEEVINSQYFKNNLISEGFETAFLKALLSKESLGYGNYPKGLIPFHNYKEEILTAFEMHFLEAVNYAKDKDIAQLHFTVSERHIEKFKRTQSQIEKKYKDSSFVVDYSFQLATTDTLAVDNHNQPFREKNGELLFRPGGHGALIENLNNVDADIIFIKNIDNVCVHEFLNEIVDYKKALGGSLLEIQEKVFETLENLDKEKPEAIDDAQKLLSHCFHQTTKIENFTKAKALLNKPIRVCGMVKNEGAPGGGPFWVKDIEGKASLQIVESAQIDMSKEDQKEIVSRSSHFNPVDLVCGVKNYKGEKFNLLDFVDPAKGFISEKSKNGNTLKALELPGLWNGAMANWNTIFIEVPLVTFNPVKSVVDLLKPSHQPNS